MAHQRCDVEQHIKSYGLRRVAKRDCDGWLVVSVRLFFGMWNIDVFAGQRVGVPSIAVWWPQSYNCFFGWSLPSECQCFHVFVSAV